MRSRLFASVVAGGFALAAPLTLSACGGAASPAPSSDAAAGTTEPGDASADGDTAPSDASHDADADGDGGWAPTK